MSAASPLQLDLKPRSSSRACFCRPCFALVATWASLPVATGSWSVSVLLSGAGCLASLPPVRPVGGVARSTMRTERFLAGPQRQWNEGSLGSDHFVSATFLVPRARPGGARPKMAGLMGDSALSEDFRRLESGCAGREDGSGGSRPGRHE